VEVLTWRQLRLHAKPVIIIDICGWAKPLVALVDSMIGPGFVDAGNRDYYRVVPGVAEALALLEADTSDVAAAPAERL